MYTHSAILCALLSALLPTLAEPNQSISLAGRRHGLRRSGLCNRAGRDGGRVSANKSASTSAPAATSSTSVKSQVASQNTVAVDAPTVAPTTAVPLSPAASSAASSGTPSSSESATGGKATLTPNGIKAGMTLCTGLDEFTGKLGWCYGMFTSQIELIHRLVPYSFPAIWYGWGPNVMGRRIE
jgi:hypothetical protein